MINMKNKKSIFIILILFILFLSLFPYFFYLNNNNRNICITINGQDMTTEYLNNDKYLDTELTDSEKKVINISTEYGNNKIAIYKHQVECIYSDCSNQICVHTGLINDQYDNQLIICAPHSLVVYYK